MFGTCPPGRVAGADRDQPHHPGMKPRAPVGPELTAVLPLAVDGIDRKVIWCALNRGEDLPGGEGVGALQARLEVGWVDGTRVRQGMQLPFDKRRYGPNHPQRPGGSPRAGLIMEYTTGTVNLGVPVAV